jgi:hypothetical protein
VIRRAERWLFAAGSAERLAALRIGLCSVLAVRLLVARHADLAGQPAALFRPRSFMGFLQAMPPRGVALAIQVAAIALAALAAVGWRARVTLPAAWVLAVLLGGMANSMGKIVHNDVLLLLALVPLLPAPTSDAWSLDARRRRDPAAPSGRYGWPVRTAMVVVAGAYFFVGLAKVVHSGPAWVTSDNLRFVLYASSDAQGEPNLLALFIADRPALAHLVAAATLLLELSFPLVLLRPRLAPMFVAGAVALHLGIYLTMGLDYSAQAATVVVVLTDWPAVVVRVRTAVQGARSGAAKVGRVRHPVG